MSNSDGNSNRKERAIPLCYCAGDDDDSNIWGGGEREGALDQGNHMGGSAGEEGETRTSSLG